MDLLSALWPGSYSRRQYIAGVILFLSYFVAAQVGNFLFTAPAVVYPAAGIALAGLVLEGVALWPAILLGALVNYLFNGSALGYLFILPLAHTLQAIVGTLVLKKLDFDPLLRRLRDMFSLIGVAITVSLIVPAGGALGVWVNRLITGDYHSSITFGTWWTGVMLSLLVVAPLIIRWGAELYFKRTIRQIIELCFIFATLLTLDWLLFWVGLSQIGGISPVYFLLVPLFWLAIRIGPRFTILGFFFTTIIALIGTIYGPHAAGLDSIQLGTRVFQMEIFINILAVIFYIIAGLQEERTEVAKALKSYIDKLEDALNRLSLHDRAKSDFIAVLAHELRNPLSPIVSSVEFLRLTPRLPEEEEALELIDDRLQTIQRLLDDLLDVSRIERSKINLKTKTADLRMMINRSIQSIYARTKSRRQKLDVSILEEPMPITADPVRIEQIVTNLLTNASKFTDEGGRIEITATREGDTAVICVQDSGIGIPPNMMDRIFEPFQQLETGDRKSEGLGIGLSLTKRLVDMHGGTIEARSAGANLGSEFIVRLPLDSQAVLSPIAEHKTFARTAPTVGQGRVLIVDDNIAASHGLGKLLHHKGYQVEFAFSGEEAREKTRSFIPHTVVLDIGLPDTDGYSLAQILRQKDGYRGVLVALTGYGQAEDKARAKEAGFDYHLTKPIGVMDLIAVLPPAL